MIVAGVDGCRGGWVAVYGTVRTSGVTPTRACVIERLDELDDETELVAIDIPIGLAQRAERGGRACDRAARKALGVRAASVFSAPVEGVLACETYAEALRVNRASSDEGIGLTKQCWNIAPKIREAAAFVASGRVRTFEAHPELTFATMTGAPMADPKRTQSGREGRHEALVKTIGTIPDSTRGHAPDDLLDACACLWTAWRVAQGLAMRVPEEADASGGVIWA